MADINLILAVPQGVITATSLGVEGLAWHRSPGSGKYFHGRKIMVDLAVESDRPTFEFLDEGGWRDADADTAAAMEAVVAGKRTKTALSNNAFSVTPPSAYRAVYLVKTGGEALRMVSGGPLHRFPPGDCREEMPPSAVAAALDLPDQPMRRPRLYMVLGPVQLILLSNLTPTEYAWYATHRPGKVFRQVMFAELEADQPQLAARSRYADARLELEVHPEKKTKTVVTDDSMGDVPFHAWTGYDQPDVGGLYVADRDGVSVWRFPAEIPREWERASG